VCDFINIPYKSNLIKYPKLPIFDRPDCRVRGLIAVGIGCDVHLGGVPGITVKKLMIFSKMIQIQVMF
jgi:hypothetical protein